MNEREQLYYIQHKWLPWIFYGAGKSFVQKMLPEGGQMFIDLLTAMNEDEMAGSNYCCRYTADEFQVRHFIFPDKHTTLIQLQMPKPPAALFCRHIYLALNTESGDKFLYTIELADNGCYFLCGWAENGSHMVFETDLNESSDKDLSMILEFFSHHPDING